MSDFKSQLTVLKEVLSLEVVDELIEIFDNQQKEAKYEFRTFLNRKDYRAASKLAHKMKSSALNLGAIELGELYKQIEKSPEERLSADNLTLMDQLYEKYWIELMSWRKS